MRMQAISTEYKGPTNVRGARLIVRAQAGRITVPWDHALDRMANHIAAAKAFALRWEWTGEWVAGGNPSDKGYVFVNVEHGHASGDAFELTRRDINVALEGETKQDKRVRRAKTA